MHLAQISTNFHKNDLSSQIPATAFYILRLPEISLLINQTIILYYTETCRFYDVTYINVKAGR